ncbi:hypothetical protein HPULCUR_011513 [Helicostylum pulchrum]|uniref:Uncharacterized protein n=1 Tax=Helicostylum pulchrum TaxID=562976 RepID=A0ABP9YGD6_9FUNG
MARVTGQPHTVGNWEEFANYPGPGPIPQATTTATTSTATATATAPTSPDPPASYSEPFEEKERSSSETEKKAMKPIRLRVKRSDYSFVNLSLYDVGFK